MPGDIESDIPTGLYRHFKGKEYQVIGTGTHSETGEVVVIYRALYGDYGTWVRPLSMFTEKVEHEGKVVDRFVFLSVANEADRVPSS